MGTGTGTRIVKVTAGCGPGQGVHNERIYTPIGG